MSGPTITTVKMLPIAGLQPYGDNPRRGNVDLIANSLQTHGQYRPIVVNIGTHTGRARMRRMTRLESATVSPPMDIDILPRPARRQG